MELIRQHLLTVLLLLPLLGALGVLAVPDRRAIRGIALGTTSLVFSLTLLLLIPAFFDWQHPGAYAVAGERGVVQLTQRLAWIPSIHAEYFVGVDGLSLPMLLLSGLIFVLATAASWKVEKQVRGYFSLLLLLQTGIIGSFISLDLLLFFVFFEISLLPMYFLIGLWGGARKEYAAIKFFIYTFLGSIAILLALIGVYLATGSFDLIALPELLRNSSLTNTARVVMFLLLLFGFLVKLPSVPVHTWLPDAHVEAPTPISMILAAVLLKLGGYGLLRIAIPLFAPQAVALWWLLAGLGVLSVLYGALCALGQTDFKRLVAYSSISHMGLVLLGAAMMTPAATAGAVFMMVAHGITSAALFFIVGVVYDRLHHRDLNRLGGVINSMPLYTRLSGLMIFASLGLPGLCGFVGEIMVLMGTFNAARSGPVALLAAPWAVYLLGALAALGIVLTAGYMLWTLQRVFLGAPTEQTRSLPEIDARESLVLWPLGALAILLGVMPWGSMLMFSHETVQALLKVFE